MIYLKWLFLALLDWLLLPVWFVAAPIYSLFTADGWPSWGAWLQTYDNSPSGDERWQRLHPYGSPIGLYWRRVTWLWRNPGYGFAKYCSVGYGNGLTVKIKAKGGYADEISDKYGKEGWYYVECRNIDGDLIAFEFYCVIPWHNYQRCLRMRLGWKLLTSKFQSLGFAPLVNTANPFKSFGQ